MIIVIGKDRLRLKLITLEAEIEQTQRQMNRLSEVPHYMLDEQVKRFGQAARIRAALAKGGEE